MWGKIFPIKIRGENFPQIWEKKNTGNHLWLRRGKLRLLSQRYNEWKRWKFRPQLPKFTQTHLKQRSRVGSNGPPIHKFDARESVRFWIEKGHQHAQTKTEKVSKVIERKKKEKDAKHTSRIFTKPFYAHWWVWKCNKMLGFLRLSFGTFFILPWDISSIPPLKSTEKFWKPLRIFLSSKTMKKWISKWDWNILRKSNAMSSNVFQVTPNIFLWALGIRCPI